MFKEMDFYGQRNAERTGQVIISAGFLVGLIYAWTTQNLLDAIYSWLGGLAISFVVCVPPWPMWTGNQIKWLPVPENEESDIEDDSDNDDVKKKKKN